MSLFEAGEEPGSEALLRTAIDSVRHARAMPLSAAVLLSRDELLALLEEALRKLPEELRHARWMLRERDDFLSSTRREAEDILEASRVQAESMVQRTEIVRQAHHTSQRVVDRANEEARRLKREAEDYCDRKLAAFEDLLARTAKTVHAGRRKLHETPAVVVGAPLVSFGTGVSEPTEQPDSNGFDRNGGAFFDQDRS